MVIGLDPWDLVLGAWCLERYSGRTLLSELDTERAQSTPLPVTLEGHHGGVFVEPAQPSAPRTSAAESRSRTPAGRSSAMRIRQSFTSCSGRATNNPRSASLASCH